MSLMKRIFFFLILGSVFLLASFSVFAQEVVVKGVGPDNNSALRDASRNAVEQVVGTFIDSKTLVSKNVVALDEIYAKSQGFVRNVTVLESKQINGGWEVTARVDVNTNPDSQLMNRVAMIAQLNDPRIGVNLYYYGDVESFEQREKYLVMCVGAINENLIKQGFTHVVIPEKNEIGKISENEYRQFKNVDFLVTGKMDLHTNAVMLPRYTDYTNEDYKGNTTVTGLQRTLAELDIKVIRADTQEVVGEFRVEGDAMQNEVNRSENAAVSLAGSRAAEKVKGIFSRTASNVDGNVQIVVRTSSYDQVMKLEKALKQTAGVENVILKKYENGKGTLFVNTSLQANQIFRQLKTSSSLSVFMENSSANLLEISM